MFLRWDGERVKVCRCNFDRMLFSKYEKSISYLLVIPKISRISGAGREGIECIRQTSVFRRHEGYH